MIDICLNFLLRIFPLRFTRAKKRRVRERERLWWFLTSFNGSSIKIFWLDNLLLWNFCALRVRSPLSSAQCCRCRWRHKFKFPKKGTYAKWNHNQIIFLNHAICKMEQELFFLSLKYFSAMSRHFLFIFCYKRAKAVKSIIKLWHERFPNRTRKCVTASLWRGGGLSCASIGSCRGIDTYIFYQFTTQTPIDGT